MEFLQSGFDHFVESVLISSHFIIRHPIVLFICSLPGTVASPATLSCFELHNEVDWKSFIGAQLCEAIVVRGKKPCAA